MEFIITGFLLYGLLILAGGLALISLFSDSILPIIASLFIVGSVAMFGDWSNSFSIIIDHPFISIGVFFGYFVIGALYSLFKWQLFMRREDTIERVKSNFKTFIENMRQIEFRKYYVEPKNTNYGGPNDYTEKRQIELERVNELMKDWVAPTVEDYKNSDDNSFKISKHKSMITGWILGWPFSAIWTLTHDLIENIYNQLLNVYRKIANHNIDKILKD